MTAQVAAQLRSLSQIAVALFGLRTVVSTDGWLMITGGLELVRSSIVGVLSGGLSPDAVVDRSCLDRLYILSTAFK